jgi:hypothetical protein
MTALDGGLGLVVGFMGALTVIFGADPTIDGFARSLFRWWPASVVLLAAGLLLARNGPTLLSRPVAMAGFAWVTFLGTVLLLAGGASTLLSGI